MTETERIVLRALPAILLETKDDVSEVVLVLDVKVCMTAHVKSLPRSHTEILATGCLVKQAAPACITVSHTLVNSAPYVIVPGTKDKRIVHSPPNDTDSVLQMLRLAIPRRSTWPSIGYDAVGASVIDFRNDGSDVISLRAYPAPGPNDWLNYRHLISTLCSTYRSRYEAR